MPVGQRAGVVQESFPKLMDKLLLWDGFMHPEMFPSFVLHSRPSQSLCITKVPALFVPSGTTLAKHRITEWFRWEGS